MDPRARTRLAAHLPLSAISEHDPRFNYEVSALQLKLLTGLDYVKGDTMHAPTLSEFFDRFPPSGVYVLWLTSKNAGHWTYLVRTGETRCMFIDSYGLDVGIGEKAWGGRSNGWLRDAVKGWEVDSLKCTLQSPEPGVNTCGLYVLNAALFAQAEQRDGRAPTVASWMKSSGLKCIPPGPVTGPSANDRKMVEDMDPLIAPYL
jgi:hypothetical protein